MFEDTKVDDCIQVKRAWRFDRRRIRGIDFQRDNVFGVEMALAVAGNAAGLDDEAQNHTLSRIDRVKRPMPQAVSRTHFLSHGLTSDNCQSKLRCAARFRAW